MEKRHVFGVKYQPLPPETDRNLSYGRFLVAFALAAALALAFAGCDSLAKLGFHEEEGGGSGPDATVVAFTGIEPVADDATTTTLFLVFERDIPGLKKEHVTISSEKPELEDVAVLDIGKTDDRPGVYTLALDSIDALEANLWPINTFWGELAVTVEADNIPGYRIASSSFQTKIYVVPPRRAVRFSDTKTDGEANKKTTAWITFRLNPEAGDSLNDLEQGNVLLSVSGDANKNIATGGIPENIDGLWKVPVTGIDAEGTVKVTLSHGGYRFEPAFVEDVPVHYAKPVVLAAAADGDELLAQRTTMLTLTFDEPVDNLLLNNITVTENGTGAAKGSLDGGGKSYILTLASNSVTKSGTVSVTIAKDGYDVTNGTVQVAVYDNNYNYLATGGSATTVVKADGVYYETHTFTSTATDQSLTFTSTPVNLTAQVLVVGGGGGGGKSGGADWRAGGGGGGAVLTHPSYALASSSYSVTVGGGGEAASSATNGKGSQGGDSTFGSAFTAKGGGGGGSHSGGKPNAGSAGGSGGGGGKDIGGGVVASTVPAGGVASGNSGASVGKNYSGGGGGGAGGAGVVPTVEKSGAKGGEGIPSDITGTTVYYGGGGTGGSNVTQEESCGAYGGNAGAANTGDGGCGGGGSSTLLSGSAGGSGIVVVRFQVPSAQ